MPTISAVRKIIFPAIWTVLLAASAEAGRELGREVRPSNNMGSDHRVFVQAGVMATNIAISGAKTHSPADTPEFVRADSLELAARLVSAVVEGAMRSGK